MKFSLAIGTILLASSATAAVCPISLLKRAGLLNKEDEAAYDAVKADRGAAEDLFHANQKKQSKRAGSVLIGPRSADGLLDLPFGGGLRE